MHFIYSMAALSTSIALFYLAMMINGLGSGMFRPANASALSLAQTPDDQGVAAGYLGSVMPIGHILTQLLQCRFISMHRSIYIFSVLFYALSPYVFIIGHPILKDHEQASTINS